MNSSREPVRATFVSTHGTMRGPSVMAMTAKTATLASVMAIVTPSD